MRDLNITEKFVADRLAVLSAEHPDPFMYDAAAGHFLDEVALTVAQVLGESAPPGRKVRFFNLLYSKLYWIEQGNETDVRLTPPAPPPPRMPEPDQHAAWVQQHLATEALPVTEAVPAAADRGLTSDQIKAARRTLRLRQRDLADQVGVPNWIVSNWEMGKETPSDDMLVQLRQALKLPATGFPPERLIEPPGKMIRLPSQWREAVSTRIDPRTPQ